METELTQLFPFAKILNFQHMDELNGLESDIYFFKIEFTGKGKKRESIDLVLKLFNGINSNILFDSEKSVKTEFEITKRMYNLGILVPQVYSYGLTDNVYFDFPFLIMEKIKGEPVHVVMKNLRLTHNFSTMKGLWAEIAHLMVQIHSIDPNEFKDFYKNAINQEDPYFYMKHDLAIWSEIIHSHSITSVLEPLMLWLKENVKQVPLERYSLIHRDIYLGNLLKTSDQELLVLDWAQSYLTDFRLDLGYTLMHFRLDGQSIIENRDHFLRIYKDKATYVVEHMEFFEILALIKNLYIQLIVDIRKSDEDPKNDVLSSVKKMKTYDVLLEISKEFYPSLAEIIEKL